MTNKLYTLTAQQFDKLERNLKSGTISKQAMVTGGAICLVLAGALVLSDVAYGTTVEERLQSVGDLFKGTGAKAEMTVATLVGTIFAGAKHSVGAALGVFGCGIGFSYYLGWLWGEGFGK